MSARRAAAAIVAIAILAQRAAWSAPPASAPPAASSDEIAADALFEEAKRLMSERSYDAACEKFAASNRLSPGIGAMLWLGDCHQAAGRIATAWFWFRAAADLAGQRQDRRRDVGLTKARAIEPRLPRLRIEASSGVTIRRGGAPVKAEELGVDIPVDPSIVHVEATAPGRRPWSIDVDLRREGAVEHVTVPPLAELPAETRAAPAAKSAPPRTPPRSTALRVAGWTGVGLGGASIAASLVFGAIARGKQSDADRGHCRAGNLCDPTGLALRDDAITAAHTATALFAIGAAAAAGGALMLVLVPSERDVATGAIVTATGRF